MRRTDSTEPPKHFAAPILLLLACLFVWAALFTFDVGDWPSPAQFPHHDPAANACGSAGAAIAYYLFHYVGDGAYPLALFVTLAGMMWMASGRVANFVQRAFGLALLVSCTAASVHLIAAGGGRGLPEGPGGVIGRLLGSFLVDTFSVFGTIVVLCYGLLAGLIFTAEGWVLRLPGLVQKVGHASGQALALARAAAAPVLHRPAVVGAATSRSGVHAATSAGSESPTAGTSREPKINGLPRREREADDAESKDPRRRAQASKPVSAARADGRLFNVDDAGAPGDAAAVAAKKGQPRDPAADDRGAATASSSAVAAPNPMERSAAAGTTATPRAEPPKRTPADGAARSAVAVPGRPETAVNIRPPAVVNFPKPLPPPSPTEVYPRPIESWTFPPLSLLVDPEYSFTAQQETVVRAKAKVLERTLDEFRLDAHVVEIDTGPVITMFELQLAPGIKVSQVASLCNDIARALKAPAVRIVAPIPGKNTVGVEVPNVDKEKVRFKELITLTGAKAAEMHLPLYLGKDAGGTPLVYDLSSMPHMLIAGTTGSGKSVCINSIIMSLLMTQQPDRCKLILVDPKMVEMSQFKDVPHLMCPIVTDMGRAEQILEWAVTNMDERYELLAEAGVRNSAAFNRMTPEEIYARFQPTTEEEKKQIPVKLPHVVIVIDELADLMMTAAKEVEHHLSRLAQKSRAVGIHIVVATQRPEAKVVTGLIKSNLPCRVAFRVASRMDSRIVLDQNGAEVLMGQGDMLFLPPGSAKLLRAQGTYLEDSELRSVIDFLTERARPEFHPHLVQIRGKENGASGEKDPLFEQAVEIMLETRRGSVSLLQRRLAIGYTRASRLIDQMSDSGIVGAYKGSQAREVVISLDEWQQIKAQLAEDLKQKYAADADDEGEGVPDLIDGHDMRG